MKTLLNPIHSLSRLLHDSAPVTLGNRYFGTPHDLLDTTWRHEASSFVISVPVPGMSKDDLNLHTDGRVLVISTKESIKLSERFAGSDRPDFKHSFVLPEGIDINSIRAKCEYGLLTISIEKVKRKTHHAVIKVLGDESKGGVTARSGKLWDSIKQKVQTVNFGKVTHHLKPT